MSKASRTHIMWGSEGRGGTNQEVLDNSQSHVLNLMQVRAGLRDQAQVGR